MLFIDLPKGSLYCGDAVHVLKSLQDSSVDMCVTSPPYWGLRDYGVGNQIGLEESPDDYVSRLVVVFREVRRILSNSGTLWLNIGDSYWGSGCRPSGNFGCPNDQCANNSNGRRYTRLSTYKPKDLVGIPWMLAFALRSDGWYLRQDIIWHKPSPMPESVRDRCTKAHEYVFLFSKSKKYHYNAEAIKEKCVTPINSKAKSGFGSKSGKCDTITYSHTNNIGKAWNRSETRNRRSVWKITTKPYKDAHYATFPIELVQPCILAGCPESGVVLDPFMGSGTTAIVAESLNRRWIGIDINTNYCELATARILIEGDKH
jgi:DNA modification methylase